MAWFDGELFPTAGKGKPGIGREWADAPISMYRGEDCNHDHVVTPIDRRLGGPATRQGRVNLFCMDCESSWWEDMANVKGSPWEIA